MNNGNNNAEQATRFPRMRSPSPSTSAPITIPSATAAVGDHMATGDFLGGVGGGHQSASSSSAATKLVTSPPPGFCGPPLNSPKRTSAAAQLVHPGETIFNLGSEMTFSSSSVVTEEDIKSSTEKRNLPSGSFLASGIASSTGSTATPSSSGSSPEGSTTSSSSSLGTIQKETVRLLESDAPISTTLGGTSTMSTISTMSAASLSPFSQLADFSLTPHPNMNGPFLLQQHPSSSFSSPAQSENFKRKKQMKEKRARKVEKNVLAQHKAEDVEGYEGEKPINDLLQSLGETVVEEKKQKEKKKGNKDKRKRKEKAQVDETEPEKEEEEKESEDKTEDEEVRTSDKKTNKRTSRQTSATNSAKTENTNKNDYFVSADEERSLLSTNENLAASSDSLNFVPVTSKKKGKKNKEEQEKMKDYSKKSKEDTGRPPPQYPSGGRDGRPPPIPPGGGGGGGRDSRPPLSGAGGGSRVTDSRRTSNYSLRSREVQISGEVERMSGEPTSPTTITAATSSTITSQPPINNTLEEFPALDISQDFPALPTAGQTDKPHIHSAWTRKPSTGSNGGAAASKKAVMTSPAAQPGEQQQLDCDNMAVNSKHADSDSADTASVDMDITKTVKTDDEAFNTSPEQTASSSVRAENRAASSGQPGHYNVSPDNDKDSAINCDKSVVSDTILPRSAGEDSKAHEGEPTGVVTPAAAAAPSTSSIPSYLSYGSSANPLLCDDFASNDGDESCERDHQVSAVADNGGEARQDCVNGSSDDGATPSDNSAVPDLVNFAVGSDNPSPAVDGEQPHRQQQQQHGGTLLHDNVDKFEFDTRSNFDSLISLPSDQNFGEISFGFEINLQLLDCSQNQIEVSPADQPPAASSPSQEVQHVSSTSKTEGEMVSAQDNLSASAQDTVSRRSADQQDEEEDNIASMDKAIISFRSSQGLMVQDGYEFGYIPPFASNYMLPQVNGSPCPETRPDEPKEVVSPESGICSPLSWQGEGEEGGHAVTSPPLQPGSYPRRTGENRDIMSQLNKSLKHLRRSSRSPSPHHSIRSGSVESYTTPRTNVSFPRSEDSGLNTTNRSIDTSTSTPNNQNHGEIVSFLKNNWNESSKDKQAKVYDGKKERR